MISNLHSPSPSCTVCRDSTMRLLFIRSKIYFDEQGDLTGQRQLTRSENPFDSPCLALCEQDDVRDFLNEGFAMSSQVFSPLQSRILDPIPSGLVGSLSTGSAGMVETQIALSNWESTHQTSRGPGHLYDYDQISDLSRGLLCPSATSRMDSTFYENNSIHLPQWANQSEDLSRFDQGVVHYCEARQLESTIASNIGLLGVLPLSFENERNNEDTTSVPFHDPISSPLCSLEEQNPPEWQELSSDLDLQDEVEINIQSNHSTGDLTSWYESFDDFLNSLARADSSSYSSPRPSLPTSSEGSPGAGPGNSTMKTCLISSLKQRKQMHRASFESCNYCGATFSRPSELKRHMSKHILPFKCSAQGCACAFAQRKDLDRHLCTRKHWQDETRPLPKVFCDVEGCKFATEGFTRKDNLLRHMRRAHNPPDQRHATNMRRGSSS